MPARSATALSSLWERLLLSWHSRSSPADPIDPRDQTWAQKLHAVSQVPEVFRASFNTIAPPNSGAFPYAILLPTFEGICNCQETSKLVILGARQVHVLEQSGNLVTTLSFPLQGQSAVEHSRILLHSWVGIRGPSVDGQHRAATLRCNSVTEHLLHPIVEQLRSRPARALRSKDPGDSRLEGLAATRRKFYSRGRSSLLKGEHIVEILMEPDIYQERLRLFGFALSRRVARAHLAMLTETELILIGEDKSQVWLRAAAHGAISTYIPLHLIVSTDVTPMAPGVESPILLTILIKDGLKIELMFASSRVTSVVNIVTALRSMQAGAMATSSGQPAASSTS